MRVHALALAALTFVALPRAAAGQAEATTPRPVAYPPRDRYVHPFVVSTTYDAPHDKTVLRLAPAPLSATLMLSALVALDGAPVRADGAGVVLTLSSTAGEAVFADERAVTLTDGDSVAALGRGWLVPKLAPGYREVVMVTLPRDAFLRWVRVPRLTLQVGRVAVPLSDELRTALTDFASRMAPGTPVQPASPSGT